MKSTRLAVFLGCFGLRQTLALPGKPFDTRSAPDSSNTSVANVMYQLSADADFHFEILRTMSLATYEGADIGETLVAAQEIKPGDFESYYSAFYKLATRVDHQARAIDAAKHPISARNAFFKAATYYRSADFFLHGNWSDPRINTLWAMQLDAFNTAMGLLPVPGERIVLHAKDDNFTIPAIFFGSGRPGPRPTLILGNGYDGSQEEMFHVVGQAVLQRGMNVITYEGPGQPTVRREQGLGFIPQWERVVTPVVDYALARPEVDSKSIGLWGYSFGGYLAPRAAAFEHRLAAVFAVDGVYDFGQSILGNLPDPLKDMFASRNVTAFDNIIREASADPATPTSMRWAIQQGMWSFGEESPFTWMEKTQQYNLTDVASRIQAPVFVADVQDDMFFPGQAEALSEKLGSTATFHRFRALDGAGEHCSMGASILLNQQTLDWFEDVLEQRNR
ncbi:hypothetical protein ACHAQH_007275 [Verticillium albo-atrum]